MSFTANQLIHFRIEGRGRFLKARVIAFAPDFDYGGMWRAGAIRVKAKGVTSEIWFPALWGSALS